MSFHEAILVQLTTSYCTCIHVHVHMYNVCVGYVYTYTDEKQKQDPAAQAEAKSGFLSYFMPWRKTERPPRAKLPSDSRPKVMLWCSFLCVYLHLHVCVCMHAMYVQISHCRVRQTCICILMLTSQ